jgi:alpha-L-rhamnosidase
VPALSTAPVFEHLPDALGIGVPAPRISWKTKADADGRQAGYELEIPRPSGTTVASVASTESVLVPWPGDPLASRERATVRVRVRGVDGSLSSWSPAGVVEAGLLSPEDWSALSVGPAWDEGTDHRRRRPPLVRTSFRLTSDVASARLYVSAHGVYEVEINGARIGTDVLSPGWTVYSERLRYYSYDVTDAVRHGENAIGAWLGDGWWRGVLGFHGGNTDLYGSDIGLIAQLEITFADGTRQTVATDSSWTATPSPVLASSLYDGESYSAAELPAGWSEPGFDDSAWSPVATVAIDHRTLVAPDGPPVRCTLELTPVSVTRTDSGALLVDFGQNFAGRLRLRGTASAGKVVRIRHAELLMDGELYTRTLRDAASIDEFYPLESGDIDWEPRFTIHGFRYAEITGWNGEIDALEIIGRVHHTDFARTGWFESSDAQLNRLHENVLWSSRSNFVDIPTDCPQRDERLGWTGDIQVVAPTASFLFDVSGMLSSWLKDVAIEQRIHGTVPWYVPVIPGGDIWTPIQPGAVWGDAAVLTPWVLYERFADPGILATQYESARGWVDQVAELAGPSRLWNTGVQLGDWLDPTAPPENPAEARTDKYLVATAYFAWSAKRLADTAAVLGRDGDATRYADIAEEVRTAFLREYRVGPGLLSNDTETAYSLAIQFALFDPSEHALAGKRLAQLVEERGYRIGTGFAGTNLVSDALSATGQVDTAYRQLFEEECPSWMYMVKQGATTIWERWDSLLPDGTVNPGGMTSFNHYALGAVADWLHRIVAGIAPVEPGYRRVRFAPAANGRLSSASAVHESPYGTVRSAWKVVGGALEFSAELPTGTTGVIELPGATPVEIGPGVHNLRLESW